VYSRRARGCNLDAARECVARIGEDGGAMLAMRARNRRQTFGRW